LGDGEKKARGRVKVPRTKSTSKNLKRKLRRKRSVFQSPFQKKKTGTGNGVPSVWEKQSVDDPTGAVTVVQ